ncbi:MAG: thioredoxin family protein [Methylococcaceae bacterium]|nr:thioredoxin family protein [Methylococcaceae bacterium]
MAAIHSTMLPLGTHAPAFNLLNTLTGTHKTLQDLRGEKATILLFICNHCPYVLHIKDQLIAIAKEYAPQGINTIAISANDIKQYPEDAPDKMQQLMLAWGNPFAAYLYDESQAVAKAYQAACTPDIIVFNGDLACVYRGRLDGATPKNNVPTTGIELRNALDNLLVGKPISEEQLPSIGCNIKWKAL